MAQAARVDEAMVRAVVAPEFTRSWHPVAHADVIDVLYEEVANTGLQVVNRTYSLTENGMDAFGAWELDQGTPESRWMMGFRNSLQKHFAVGVCSGNSIVVCSNMCFSGEYKEFRKHTSGLSEETLRLLAERAVQGFIDQCQKFQAWHEDLKVIDLPKSHFKVLTYNSMERGVLPPSKFLEFTKAYQEEEVPLHGENVFAFHGAHTRVQRAGSLIQAQGRARPLNTLINEYADLRRDM